MKRREIFLAVTGIILVIGLVLSSSNRRKPIEKTGYLMDNRVRIVVYDKGVSEGVISDALKEMTRLSKIVLNSDESSEVSSLNKLGTIKATKELTDALCAGIKTAEETKGAYDLTIYPLTSLWRYKNPYVPAEEEIAIAKEKVNINNIKIKEDEITLINGAMIDLSSVANGYIADKALSFLKEKGVKDALIDTGGNIKVMGSPYKDKKEGFVIGIQDPSKSVGIPLGQLQIKDVSVATTGIYEQSLVINGKNYHNIIDPETGYPADSDILSVSVISKDSVYAGAYAAAIVVMGSEKALEFINANESAECIIIRKDNKVLISDGIKNFMLTSDEYKLLEGK